MKAILQIYFGIILGIQAIYASTFDTKVIEQVKLGVVSINAKIHKAAYNHPGESYGSGFLVNKAQGLIITNRHVIGSATISRYEVTFFNGKQVDAKVFYYDPIWDFAVLKVEPNEIPAKAQQLILKPEEVKTDQEVFIVGKNAGQDFSFQTGRVTSLYETAGLYPAQAIRINVNNRGGSSGSPVCNKEGHIVGLIHSSNMDSYGFALWTGYITKSLESLLKNQRPTRKSIGAVWAYYSVDRAIRYLDFPSEMAAEYLEKFPESRNQIIYIKDRLKNSPARKFLRPGDIVWKVNGKFVGPQIHMVEEAINGSDPVVLTVVRRGKTIQLSFKAYNLLDHQIKRIASFAGAHFYEADELTRYLIGVKPRTILVSYVQPGTGLHQRFNMVPGLDLTFALIKGIGGHPVKNFEDVLSAIRHLKNKKFFDITHDNYGVWVEYDRWPVLSHPSLVSEGDIHPTDGPPLLHTLDLAEGEWETTEIW